MHNLTILYYTANRIPDFFSSNVRGALTRTTSGIPIVSISHKPMEFGYNICVGDIEVSVYNIYKQILLGAHVTETDYVACCEDDCLYTYEHFLHKPPLDTFAYNVHKWTVNPKVFFFRRRAGMCMCIAPRSLLIETLEERFLKFPNHLSREETAGWGEPGRYEKKLGLTHRKMEVFETEEPCLTFNHKPSLGGRRKMLSTDQVTEYLPLWGTAVDLRRRVCGL